MKKVFPNLIDSVAHSLLLLAFFIMSSLSLTACGGEDGDDDFSAPITNNGDKTDGSGNSSNDGNSSNENNPDTDVVDANGHEYVDLGLPSGTLWATCNVGASKPEEYGDYFAWGETTPKTNYDWSTYKWCNGSSNMITKYCTDAYSNTETTLELADDAANANWGGDWRMPTEDQLNELRYTTYCTWTWTTLNGVKGYKVVSKTNGNSIFLPAVGYRSDAALMYAGSYGYYWSSSCYSRYSRHPYYLHINSNSHSLSNYDRYYGYSVRPVYNPQTISIKINSSYDESLNTINVSVETTRNVTECGVCFSTTKTIPTVEDDKVTGTFSNGSCTIKLGIVNQQVYYRPYAVVDGTTYYGYVKYFIKVIEVVNYYHNGHEYVDLGLPSGTLWATCNVGATTPEDYGDYFAWGETTPKTTYDWSTYKWCNGSDITMTKYCTDSSYGTIDNKTTLELADDAANANWGGDWRMPTSTERSELNNSTYCTWRWTRNTLNGVNGYKVVSKTNGNSIFLPAAGFRVGTTRHYAGSDGYYWSSSLYSSSSYYAYDLYFYSSSHSLSSVNRYSGNAVRPVLSGSAKN